ncbi:MAG: type II toxin-antitoxin system death-on-curing family toxin [Tatlockia sp.]|nr:type II toxin-antitoxin system death-on-curing family toxin [Tatlockia sp.]
MSDIAFLSAEQIGDIQKATLSMAPSSNIGLIEGAVNRIINEYHYKGTTDIFELAALYLIAIAKAHAFPDANKRTAYQAALMFLDLNGIFISENESLIEITIKAAEGTTNIQEIVDVFKHSID